LPYVAKLEKAGIPTVVIDYEDQTELIKQTAAMHGVPNIRCLHSSRLVPGPEAVDEFFEPMIEALIRPLTEEEEESGRFGENQGRILFEGTLEEAQTFYQQTRHVPFPLDAPIAVYTDGYPIIVPTEERVKEMLTGTSHSPDELIPYAASVSDRTGEVKKKGDPVRFQPMNWTATVEKVATIAVMAGCKPEHLPVVLAIAQSECAIGTAGGSNGQWACVSGPIAKEIKMNFGIGMLDPGNPANTTIGRTYQLMAINLSGAVSGINRLSNFGNPFNTGGTCFAESMDALPTGWKGLNEEYGYKRDESVVMVVNGPGMMGSAGWPPGGYRALQKSGHGGVARRLDVKGQPGPHNFLEYMVPAIWATREGGRTFVLMPQMAHHLAEIGFKSKDEVYEWIWKKSFEPLKDFKLRAGPDLTTNGWMGIERVSGKHWKELPDDQMVPAGGNDPFGNCIIVAGGEDETLMLLSGRGTAFSIDVWR
jgi:hypothetical protein